MYKNSKALSEVPKILKFGFPSIEKKGRKSGLFTINMATGQNKLKRRQADTSHKF